MANIQKATCRGLWWLLHTSGQAGPELQANTVNLILPFLETLLPSLLLWFYFVLVLEQPVRYPGPHSCQQPPARTRSFYESGIPLMGREEEEQALEETAKA